MTAAIFSVLTATQIAALRRADALGARRGGIWCCSASSPCTAAATATFGWHWTRGTFDGTIPSIDAAVHAGAAGVRGVDRLHGHPATGTDSASRRAGGPGRCSRACRWSRRARRSPWSRSSTTRAGWRERSRRRSSCCSGSASRRASCRTRRRARRRIARPARPSRRRERALARDRPGARAGARGERDAAPVRGAPAARVRDGRGRHRRARRARRGAARRTRRSPRWSRCRASRSRTSRGRRSPRSSPAPTTRSSRLRTGGQSQISRPDGQVLHLESRTSAVPTTPPAHAAARARRDRGAGGRPDDPLALPVPAGSRRGPQPPDAPHERGDRERAQPHRARPARRTGAGRVGRVALARGGAAHDPGRRRRPGRRGAHEDPRGARG